jgi:hypothetical protein
MESDMRNSISVAIRNAKLYKTPTAANLAHNIGEVSVSYWLDKNPKLSHSFLNMKDSKKFIEEYNKLNKRDRLKRLNEIWRDWIKEAEEIYTQKSKERIVSKNPNSNNKEIKGRKLRSDAVRIEEGLIVIGRDVNDRDDIVRVKAFYEEYLKEFEKIYNTKVLHASIHNHEGKNKKEKNIHIHFLFRNVDNDGVLVKRRMHRKELSSLQDLAFSVGKRHFVDLQRADSYYKKGKYSPKQQSHRVFRTKASLKEKNIELIKENERLKRALSEIKRENENNTKNENKRESENKNGNENKERVDSKIDEMNESGALIESEADRVSESRALKESKIKDETKFNENIIKERNTNIENIKEHNNIHINSETITIQDLQNLIKNEKAKYKEDRERLKSSGKATQNDYMLLKQKHKKRVEGLKKEIERIKDNDSKQINKASTKTATNKTEKSKDNETEIKDEAVSQKQDNIAEKDETIKTLQHKLKNADKTINEYEDKSKIDEKMIQSLKKTIKAIDDTITQLQNEIKEKDKTIQSLKDEISILKKRLEIRDKNRQLWRKKLNKIQNILNQELQYSSSLKEKINELEEKSKISAVDAEIIKNCRTILSKTINEMDNKADNENIDFQKRDSKSKLKAKLTRNKRKSWEMGM